jgi:hypothetical protein
MLAQGLSCTKNASVFDPSHIRTYTSEELIGFLTLDAVNRAYQRGWVETDITVQDELIRRKPVAQLLEKFENPVDDCQQRYVAEALYAIEDPRILACFRKRVSTDVTWVDYLCVNYVAKTGDTRALKILNDNYRKYPTSSVQWSCTVELFGRFHYEPAIPNLIESLGAASLNLVDAAQGSLEQLFPGPHPEFKTIHEAETYFQRKYNDLRQQAPASYSEPGARPRADHQRGGAWQVPGGAFLPIHGKEGT